MSFFTWSRSFTLWVRGDFGSLPFWAMRSASGALNGAPMGSVYGAMRISFSLPPLRSEMRNALA